MLQSLLFTSGCCHFLPSFGECSMSSYAQAFQPHKSTPCLWKLPTTQSNQLRHLGLSVSLLVLTLFSVSCASTLRVSYPTHRNSVVSLLTSPFSFLQEHIFFHLETQYKAVFQNVVGVTLSLPPTLLGPPPLPGPSGRGSRNGIGNRQEPYFSVFLHTSPSVAMGRSV